MRQAGAEVRTPLRAAVEQWPSQAERAQTRLLDYLALGREACQVVHNTCVYFTVL